MRTAIIRLLMAPTFFLLAGIGIAAAQQAGGTTPVPGAAFMKLTSPAFADSSPIPVKYTCSAQPAAVSPELDWTDVPKGTVSFALIVHDPEPHPNRGKEDVLHWIAWNIPADATHLSEDVPAKPDLPDGMRQGKNVRGDIGFRGPCPPPGLPHHYTFELYALDIKLDLPTTATREEVLDAMNGHIIGHGVLIGLFHR